LNEMISHIRMNLHDHDSNNDNNDKVDNI
jgi:hypothetical protein